MKSILEVAAWFLIASCLSLPAHGQESSSDGGITDKVEPMVEDAKEKVEEFAQQVDQSPAAAEASAGILKPIYALAEQLSFPAFYWIAFTLLTVGVVSLRLQLVLAKLVVLTRAGFSLTEILSDALGLAISLVGLVLTTQAATQNSSFPSSPAAVLSATAVGVVFGVVFYWWGQKQELQAVQGRTQKAPRRVHPMLAGLFERGNMMQPGMSIMRLVRPAIAGMLLVAGSLVGHCSVAPGEEPTIAAEGVVLGIAGDRFTLDGKPTFLLGVSYYGGLGAAEEAVRRDLDELQAAGFNWLRFWATWDSFGENVSAVDAEGKGREPWLARLQSLMAECDWRRMVVDVTLARARRSNRSAGSVHLPDLASHEQAVRTIVEALKPHRNWYLDLANERDVSDERFVPVEELKQLRQEARELHATLLVTASFGGHDLTASDVRDALQTVKCDFLAVHRPRTPDSPRQTAARTREVLGLIAGLNLAAPVHHQEPFRRGYGDWEPLAGDFLDDLRGACEGGAAGWCFHNGTTKSAADGQPRRSFDLRQERLIDQLDAEERQVIAGAGAVITEAERSR